MARQTGPTVRELESSELVDVIAKPSRVDDVPPDFSRLSTGQKPVAVFLNGFFSDAVPANLGRIAPARCTIDNLTGSPFGLTTLTPCWWCNRTALGFISLGSVLVDRLQPTFDTVLQVPRKIAPHITAAHCGEKIIARHTVFDFVHARDLKHDLAVRRFTNWSWQRP